MKLFPSIKIVVVADGLYTTVNLIKWYVENKIPAEMRMHSNRVVVYKGTQKKLRELANQPGIKLAGRQTARTISVDWHGLPLEITIVKRIDKHGDESIVFQAATYKSEPREHVKTYKIRWLTEKFYRTSKQSLGLGECYSKDLVIQHNHVAAILLAYALMQMEMKMQRLKTPEDAIRGAKGRFNQDNFYQFVDRFGFSSQLDA